MNILFDKKTGVYSIGEFHLSKEKIESILNTNLENLFNENWGIIDSSNKSYKTFIRKQISKSPPRFVTDYSESISMTKKQENKLKELIDSLQIKSLIDFELEKKEDSLKQARGLYNLIGKRIANKKESVSKMFFEESFGKDNLVYFLNDFKWQVNKDFELYPVASTVKINDSNFATKTRIIKIKPNSYCRVVIEAKTQNNHNVYAKITMSNGVSHETPPILNNGDFNKVFVDFNTGDNDSFDIFVGSDSSTNNHRFILKKIQAFTDDEILTMPELVQFIDIISKSSYFTNDVTTQDYVIKQEFCCAISQVMNISQKEFLKEDFIKCGKINRQRG